MKKIVAAILIIALAIALGIFAFNTVMRMGDILSEQITSMIQ